MKSFVLVSLLASSAMAADVFTDSAWTGLGGGDRWCNPDNWLGGQIPTSASRIIDDPAVNWYAPHARHISATIDASAAAGEWNLERFGYPPVFPFTHIHIAPGADFHAGLEGIDQPEDGGTYRQTGGAHTTGSFDYRSGDFRMDGGTFTAGSITARPDGGSFRLLGGVTQAARFEISTGPGYVGPFFELGGTAELHVTERFVFSADPYRSAVMTFDRPIHLDGADFTVESELADPNPYGDFDPFNDLHLIFVGGAGGAGDADGADDVGLLEVSSFDYGGDDPFAWVDNAMIDTIEIAADQHIRLVDQVPNHDWLAAQWTDAQYVDTLTLHSGAVLDLDGITVYVRVLDNRGGSFINGQPVIVPEPGTPACLLAAAAGLRRRRR